MKQASKNGHRNDFKNFMYKLQCEKYVLNTTSSWKIACQSLLTPLAMSISMGDRLKYFPQMKYFSILVFPRNMEINRYFPIICKKYWQYTALFSDEPLFFLSGSMYISFSYYQTFVIIWKYHKVIRNLHSGLINYYISVTIKRNDMLIVFCCK